MMMSKAEQKMAKLCHRSIVADRDIPAGTVITNNDIAFKRPGTGIMPYDVGKVLGMRAKRGLLAGAIIELCDLEQGSEG